LWFAAPSKIPKYDNHEVSFPTNLDHTLHTMALPRPLLQYICGLVLFVACSQALKFELQGVSDNRWNEPRCIRNFVSKDTLVVVTATIDGEKGDGMIVNINVSSATGALHIAAWSLQKAC